MNSLLTNVARKAAGINLSKSLIQSSGALCNAR